MKVYVRRNGKTFGPYPLDQIKGFLNDGRLLRSDEASEDQESWDSLESFLELEKKAEELKLPEPESIEALLSKTSATEATVKPNPDSSPSSSRPKPATQNIKEDTNFNYLVYEHPTLGTKVVKRGFRWAALLLGFAYYLYHRDFKSALRIFILTGIALLFIHLVENGIYSSLRSSALESEDYIEKVTECLSDLESACRRDSAKSKNPYDRFDFIGFNGQVYRMFGDDSFHRQVQNLMQTMEQSATHWVDYDWKKTRKIFTVLDVILPFLIARYYACSQELYIGRSLKKRGYKPVHACNAESFDMALANYSESKRQG